MEEKNLNIKITTNTIFTTVFVLIFFYLLYQIIDVILILLTSLIFASAITPGKKFLLKFRIPAPVAVMIMYILAFLLFFFLIYSILPVIASQYNLFIENLPAVYEYMQRLVNGTPFESFFTQNESSFQSTINSYLSGVTSYTITGIASFFNGVINFVLFLVFTFLFSVRPDGVDNFFRVISPPKYRPYVINLWSRTQRKMSQWFQGQIILMLFIGVLTFLLLTLLGVPNTLFLSFFAGIMELIPLFGPFIAAIPAILITLTLGDSGILLGVILVYISIQFLENHLIHPIVVTKMVGIPPVSVILSIVIGVQLAGFIGAVIAVPLTAAIQELYRDIRDNRIKEIINAHIN